MGQGKRKGNSVSPSPTAYNIHTFKFSTSFAWSCINFLLPGCPAFGETEAAALEEVEIGIELGVETAKKEGPEIPQPYGKEVFDRGYEKQHTSSKG